MSLSKPSFSQIQRVNATVTGSDPEVFVLNHDKTVKPAFTFLPDKTKPIGQDGGPDEYHVVYNDGFQAEMRALPCACIAYVVDSIRNGLKRIYNESKGGSLTIANCPMIPIKTLRETPDEYVILGCDPSRNAYNMGGKAVDDPRALRYRFTGFHIHSSGWHLPKGMDAREKMFVPYVHMFDKILGVFFVAAGAHLESAKRREYYGLAGEYRLPDHGLEYRVLSSVVLSHPAIVNLAFELSRSCIALVDSKAEHLWQADFDETIGVINSNDQKAARALITRNKELLQYLVGMNHYDWENKNEKVKTGKAAYDMAMNGIDSLVKDPNDFPKNWKFFKQWNGHADGINEGWRGLTCGH